MGIWREEGRFLRMGIGREAERDSLGVNSIAIYFKDKQTRRENEGRRVKW